MRRAEAVAAGCGNAGACSAAQHARGPKTSVGAWKTALRFAKRPGKNAGGSTRPLQNDPCGRAAPKRLRHGDTSAASEERRDRCGWRASCWENPSAPTRAKENRQVLKI
jgi:hypothetical protein